MTEPEIVIVGTGFGGIGMAIELRRSGFDDFVVLEKAEPGIPEYLRRAVDKFDIRRHIRLRSDVVALDFDDDADRWHARTADGRHFQPRAVVLAPGPPHEPSVPDFPGRDVFRGCSFHSAQWDNDFEATGKRIAVIGTGASAVRFVPQIAEQAEQVTVFHRTPQWIVPRPLSPVAHRMFRYLPGAQRLYRWATYRDYESSTTALQRENVALVTSPIASITESGIVTADGIEQEFDAIVYGAGLEISDWFADQHIVGANGLTLQKAWRTGMEGFLGVAVHGFPNLFLIIGPNSGGGNQSIVIMIEAQARYIRRCLELLRMTANSRIEVRAATQHEFNRRVQSKPAGVSYWRTMRRPDPGHYDLTVPADREPAHEYSGPALLDAPGVEVPVEVTLGGHPDPIDGRYHWYGRLAPSDGQELPDPGRAEVLLTLPGGVPTAGRLQERDPWGNLRIVGTGTPPYPLTAV
ncbi:DUF4873 domain-containing protein [Nocardia pseudovaccinii]|uniref:DUF4873 domain-containing protein n=1 Tax=Nocardia pseudovaccinii TaxID=189540 RepID=UPI003D8F385D